MGLKLAGGRWRVRPVHCGATSAVVCAVLVCFCDPSAAEFAQQGAKLVGIGGSDFAAQGYAVALSSDGNTAIVGGYNDGGGAGAAWIFIRRDGLWLQQGPKLRGDGATDTQPFQGKSVALSADGNTAILGAPGDSGSAGAAWVFVRSGEVWTQQGPKLVGSGAVGAAAQGQSVAISGDGSFAAIGGPADDDNVGATWMFSRHDGVWAQGGPKLVGAGAEGRANQGVAVALSADGTTAIIGGYSDAANTGAAWIFAQAGGAWIQQGPKLVGDGHSANATEGLSVALSADGDTAIVGGPQDRLQAGAAWVFVRTAGRWTQQGSKLVAPASGRPSLFATSVALSGDGDIAMVGAPDDNAGAGAVWVFTRSGAAWSLDGSKLFGSGGTLTPLQGQSVAVSGNGRVAIVGGYEDNNGVGAAWIFVQRRSRAGSSVTGGTKNVHAAEVR